MSIDKKDKRNITLIKAIAGLDVKLADLFGDDCFAEETGKKKFGFRSSFDENALELKDAVGDDLFDFIELAKSIHDAGLLANIMKGCKYLSEARVQSYKIHEADLKQLKALIKKYDPKSYASLFRKMKPGNYSAYVGSVNSYGKVERRNVKDRKIENLYKTIKATINDFPDDPDKDDIIAKIDAGVFLPKQLTPDNGVIPNQVHARELRAILRNASKYHPFLNEKDETGYTTLEKIVMLYEFRIPYFVGPLGQAHKDEKGYNVWAERKGTDRIYPWNFEDQVDLKASAAKFIDRMVRRCTYLSGEITLPKQSLMYERFMVLNEINNININGSKLSVDIKQELYHVLFEAGGKVNQKKLRTFFISRNLMSPEDEIGGIDGDCKQSLSSIGKFRGVFGEDVYKESVQNMIEDIIFWATVYGNDKKFVTEKIREKYPSAVTDVQIKRICGFKFEGWGNLSKAFLELPGNSYETGEHFGILQALWETNDNLMMLLSDRYSFKESLAELVDNSVKPLKEWTIDDLDDMYLSAPVKRMVWQTVRIVDEIESVMGHAPEKVFVEMTRGGGEKGDRKDSRKKMLSDLYASIGAESDLWTQEVADKPEQYFRIKKVYLYYRQMGRCMYTGEPIDLDRLMNDNLYDIDHIYPRHFVKDDSIENNLVLVRKEINNHKQDVFPIEPSIRKAQAGMWKCLLDKHFITKEKYNRLMRTTGFTEEEKAGFISRQIVETAQGTKAITQILTRALPESEIVFSKAGLVSDFRHQFDLPKARCVNDFHHANDAYLNIVVGNTYNIKFTKSPMNFIKEAAGRENEAEYAYHMGKLFERDVIRGGVTGWIAARDNGPAGTIGTVRRIMAKNSPLVTQMPIEGHGQIFDATIVAACKSKPESYVGVKTSDPALMDVTKYGGVTSISTSGYCLIAYKNKKKEIRSLEALPVYLGTKDALTPEKELEYFRTIFQRDGKTQAAETVRIIIPFIYQRIPIKFNGYCYYLGGKTGDRLYVYNSTQMVLEKKWYSYAHKLEKAVEFNRFGEVDENSKTVITKQKNIDLYDLIFKKFTETVFSKRVNSLKEIIERGRTVFVELDIAEQCKILLALINNISSAQKANLKMIKGSENAGVLLMSKYISSASEFKLIYQSVTGLFSHEIDCLKI